MHNEKIVNKGEMCQNKAIFAKILLLREIFKWNFVKRLLVPSEYYG